MALMSVLGASFGNAVGWQTNTKESRVNTADVTKEETSRWIFDVRYINYRTVQKDALFSAL